MRQPMVQVSVTAPLKARLEAIAAANGLSLSSYVRVVINHHILALDRQERPLQHQPLQPLPDFYRTL
jgi:hypothetical protein